MMIPKTHHPLAKAEAFFKISVISLAGDYLELTTLAKEVGQDRQWHAGGYWIGTSKAAVERIEKAFADRGLNDRLSTYRDYV